MNVIDATVSFEEFKEMVGEGYKMSFDDDNQIIIAYMINSEKSFFIHPRDLCFYEYFKDYYIQNHLMKKYSIYQGEFIQDSLIIEKILKDDFFLNSVEKITIFKSILNEDNYSKEYKYNLLKDYKFINSKEFKTSEFSIFQIDFELKNGMTLNYRKELQNDNMFIRYRKKLNPFKKRYFRKRINSFYLFSEEDEFEKLILSIKDSFKEKMVFEETENNELEYSVYLIHKLETDLNPSTSRKITEFKSKMI